MSLVKIAVLGGASVGKSCIVGRYVSQTFFEDYEPTLEDSFRKQVLIDEQSCVLDIYDTAGMDGSFILYRQFYISNQRAFVSKISLLSESNT